MTGPDVSSRPTGLLTLFLAGDVMTGRGIDQILPHPGDPDIYESAMRSAIGYVELAERASGPIARRVPFDYVWGEARGVLERCRPEARIVNLETAVTRAGRPAPKGINYRMHPANMPVLAALGVDCCGLANNHVLDWGRSGLADTLAALDDAGIAHAGAGSDAVAASRPAALPHRAGGRILVFAFALASSGVPGHWAATGRAPGVSYLADLSAASLRSVADAVRRERRPGDVVVASLHWGPNWGYEIGRDERAFARALVEDGGVDVVHGHSSHHAKAIEIHRDRLILYGCGDFLNDYEGIAGYEPFRADLAVAYFPVLRASDGALVDLALAVFRIERFRLVRAPDADVAWLARVLTRESERLGAAFRPAPDASLALARPGATDRAGSGR